MESVKNTIQGPRFNSYSEFLSEAKRVEPYTKNVESTTPPVYDLETLGLMSLFDTISGNILLYQVYKLVYKLIFIS